MPCEKQSLQHCACGNAESILNTSIFGNRLPINIMKQKIAHIALVVDDYDRAIEFYTRKLNFDLIEDTVLSDEKRWVLVAPKGSTECCLLLVKATNDIQKSRVGNQTGGWVFLFLYTDNFQRGYQNLIDMGISIVRTPVQETYGTVAVFEDLYGNLWDLIGPSTNNFLNKFA